MTSSQPTNDESCCELSVSSMVRFLNQDMNTSDFEINATALEENVLATMDLNASTPLPRLHQSMSEVRGHGLMSSHENNIKILKREVTNLRWVAYEQNKK